MPNDQVPRPSSKLEKILTNVSGIEIAFGKPHPSDVGNSPDLNQIDSAERQRLLIEAREEFIKLYQPAAMSYIRGVMTRLTAEPKRLDQDVGEVWSNLVTRLLEGNFTSFKHTGVNGSFRRWLRRVIANECKAHLRKMDRVLGSFGPRNSVSLVDEGNELGVLDPTDRTLEDVLRKTVIENAYEAMEDDGLNGAAVLFAAEQGGDFSSDQLAEHLSQISGKTIKLDAAKKRLQRGRQLFAQTLLEQVAKLDGTSDPDRIEETLIELDLMANCRKALTAMRRE